MAPLNLDKDEDLADFHRNMMSEVAKLDDAIKVQDCNQFKQVKVIIEDE